MLKTVLNNCVRLSVNVYLCMKLHVKVIDDCADR